MKRYTKLLIIVVALALFIQFGLGSLVKTGINNFGPDVLGTDVSVESVTISPLTGDVRIKNLVVQNPQGFSDNPMFALGEVVVDLEVLSLFGDKIRIAEITVDSPLIRYERGLGSGSNLDALQAGLAGDSAAEDAPAEDTAPAETAAADESGKGVEIDVVSLRGAKVKVAFSGVGATLPLPPLTVKDIGKNEGGASIPEAIEKVLSAIVGAIAELDTSSVIKGAGDAVKGGLDALKSLF